MRLLLVLAVIVVCALALSRGTSRLEPVASASPSRELYQGRTIEWWARRTVQARKDANARGRTIRRLRAAMERARVEGIGPTLAIRLVFGERAAGALRVAWCESRYSTGARNGQYLGLFQMGSYARSTYGHSSSALGQAQAAYRYFVASGRDWSPWECKP